MSPNLTSLTANEYLDGLGNSLRKDVEAMEDSRRLARRLSRMEASTVPPSQSVQLTGSGIERPHTPPNQIGTSK